MSPPKGHARNPEDETRQQKCAEKRHHERVDPHRERPNGRVAECNSQVRYRCKARKSPEGRTYDPGKDDGRFGEDGHRPDGVDENRQNRRIGTGADWRATSDRPVVRRNPV